MKTVYIIGSINTDLVIHAPYMPKRGETLTGGGFFSAHGGKGANQAVACARLGGKVVMGGCVGDDAFGEEARASLSAEGIDVSHIRTVPDTPTGTAVIIVSDGDNRIILDKGANAALSEGDVEETLRDACPGDIFLCPLENPVPVIGYALRRAKEKGLFVIHNPAPADPAILSYLPFCDLLTPNETEAALLSGKPYDFSSLPEYSPDRPASAETPSSQDKKYDSPFPGLPHLLVTLGGDGFALDGVHYPCPLRVTPVDTTAAGDTFCGGMAARLARGDSLSDAALYGSRAASLACTRSGAQPSIPTATELA